MVSLYLLDISGNLRGLGYFFFVTSIFGIIGSIIGYCMSVGSKENKQLFVIAWHIIGITLLVSTVILFLTPTAETVDMMIEEIKRGLL